MYGTCVGHVSFDSRCLSPSEPPAAWWRDGVLKICPSAAPESHLVSIHPPSLSHPSLSTALSCPQCKYSNLCNVFRGKKTLNQLCRIDAVLTFDDFKASWTETAAVVDAAVSTSAVKLKADVWWVRQEARCMITFSIALIYYWYVVSSSPIRDRLSCPNLISTLEEPVCALFCLHDLKFKSCFEKSIATALLFLSWNGDRCHYVACVANIQKHMAFTVIHIKHKLIVAQEMCLLLPPGFFNTPLIIKWTNLHWQSSRCSTSPTTPPLTHRHTPREWHQ